MTRAEVQAELKRHGINTDEAVKRVLKAVREQEPRVFENCNVCGRKIRTPDEEEMGMCEDCAFGWQN